MPNVECNPPARLPDVQIQRIDSMKADNPAAPPRHCRPYAIYSRDQRSDCKQVCIGLVCTPEGLPLSFEVFAGNRSDVTTVEEIVTSMETKYGRMASIRTLTGAMC